MIEPTPYSPSIREIIREEVSKLGFGDCKVVIYEDPRELSDIDDLVTSRFGVSEEGIRVEFYTAIIEDVFRDQESFILNKYSSMEKWIQAIVRHEFRHYSQFKFAKDNGVDMKLFQNQFDILEKDAYEYENGKINDLSKIIKI